MGLNDEDIKLVAAKAVISGKVQGVFYRVWVSNTAKHHHLKGWVRNSKDGKVEAFFEGEKKEVEEMIEKCKEGSKFSDVEEVKFKWVEPKGLTGFEVNY